MPGSVKRISTLGLGWPLGMEKVFWVWNDSPQSGKMASGNSMDVLGLECSMNVLGLEWLWTNSKNKKRGGSISFHSTICEHRCSAPISTTGTIFQPWELSFQSHHTFATLKGRHSSSTPLILLLRTIITLRGLSLQAQNICATSRGCPSSLRALILLLGTLGGLSL